MVKKSFKITNELGLHGRAASKLVNLVSKYKSDITFCRDNIRVNGRSIMGVLHIGANVLDKTISIETRGEDCQDAMNAIYKFIVDGIGEEVTK